MADALFTDQTTNATGSAVTWRTSPNQPRERLVRARGTFDGVSIAVEINDGNGWGGSGVVLTESSPAQLIDLGPDPQLWQVRGVTSGAGGSTSVTVEAV